jgi:pimeloyl-ACP methyl ester carboxylesterase
MLKKDNINRIFFIKLLICFTPIIIFVFLSLTPILTPVYATTIFSDSFSKGFKSDFWSVRANYLSPITSEFGIKDNLSSTWYILDSNTSILPDNSIVKFDMKINTIPSEVIFSCKTNFKNDQNFFNDDDLRIYLLSNGIFSFDSFIDGGGWASGGFSWDNSAKSHSIELLCNNGSMSLKEDDNTLMSITTPGRDFSPSDHVYFGYRNGDSEFANYQLCDVNGCTDIQLTPSPTPTPSPSPTPTPTPTPNVQIPKKVVIVPGMGGSWNLDALLNCKSNGYTGSWTKWVTFYDPLVTKLQDAGYQPSVFYYDWRKPISSNSTLLTTFIQNTLEQPNETVDIVGHSMGGLIGRSYLESTKYNSHLDKLLTVGSPHNGSVLAYPAWSGGEMWVNDTNVRLAFALFQSRCFRNHASLPKNAVQNYIPSFQNTLPIFDYLIDKHSGKIKPVSSMHDQNNWLPTAFTPPFYGVTVGAISGTGHQTLSKIETTPPTKADQLVGRWTDGRPTNRLTYEDGDGTVLLSSSQLPGASNISLPLEHTELVTESSGQNAILNFLDGFTEPQLRTMKQPNTQNIKPSKYASALMIVVDNAHATLTDKHGNKILDSEGQITILNPNNEEYKLSVTPLNNIFWKSKYTVLVIQLFDDGTSKWKQYDRKDLFRKHFKLRFDRNSHREDIMQEN